MLLAKNVGHVLAVDVGRKQLAEKIATNPRVTVMDLDECATSNDKYVGEAG